MAETFVVWVEYGEDSSGMWGGVCARHVRYRLRRADSPGKTGSSCHDFLAASAGARSMRGCRSPR